MWKIIFLTLLIIFIAQNAIAVCNKCKSGFTCVSETEFKLCHNDVTYTKVYKCPNDKVCISEYPMCRLKSDGGIPACNNRQNCECTGAKDNTFTCTSRNTFTMCLNGAYTYIHGRCEDDKICNVQSAKNGEFPCKKMCIEEVEDNEICDFSQPIDTTNPTGTTPTSTPPQGSSDCSNQTVEGRYPDPNDYTCRRYIFCHLESGVMIGTLSECPNNRYFNAVTRLCQQNKPTGCS